MTGRRSPYLLRREGTYYLRLSVPIDLRERVGRSEIRRSLRTSDASIAKYAAGLAAFEFARLCRRLRAMTDKTKFDIQSIVNAFLSKLMQSYDPGSLQSDQDWHELEYADTVRLERLEKMIFSQVFDDAISLKASEALSANGIDWQQLSNRQRRELLDGVARAERELVHYGAHWREQPFTIYEPRDEVFRNGAVQLASQLKTAIKSPKAQKPLAEYVQSYLTSDANDWTEATRKEKHIPLAWFVEEIGAERDIREIESSQILSFRDAVLRLRKHCPAKTSLSKAQTALESERVHPRTARKKFDTVMAFLRWLYSIGEIDDVPGNKISIKIPPTPHSQKRRPFTPNELDAVFTSPIYHGCKSISRRSTSGSVVHLDDEYWIPLLLAYTGMRISEPLQLRGSDIILDDTCPHIHLDASSHKLKSAAADRQIPIHSDVIEFGFLDFVEARAKKPNRLLFYKIRSNSEVGNYYSKKFGRYLRAIGLIDKRLVAHSFRHSFKTALRNAKVPEGEQNFLMGHSDYSTAHGYGVASDIEVLQTWVQKIDFGLASATRQLLLANRTKGPVD